MSDDENTEMGTVPVEEASLELLAYLKSKMASSGKTIVKTNDIAAKLQQVKVRKPDGKGLGFEDTLSLSTQDRVEKDVPNFEDDIQRELIFYNQSLEVAKRAIDEIEKLSIPWKRPDDYFAEMLKSDHHMEKIKRKLIVEKKRIETIEERKKQAQQKKFGKQMQLEAKQEKEKAKKREIEKVNKWRKAREQGADEEFNMELDLDEPEDKKRKFKESIPVFNNKTKKPKFNNSKDRKGGSGGGGKFKAKRPGKNQRQKSFSKKR